MKMGQGSVIEMDLHFGCGDFGVKPLSGLAETDVFGDDALVPPKTKAGKLQIDALSMKFFEQGPFDETGEADLVEINQGGEDQENAGPHRDPKTAKVNTQQAPESTLAAEGGMAGIGWQKNYPFICYRAGAGIERRSEER